MHRVLSCFDIPTQTERLMRPTTHEKKVKRKKKPKPTHECEIIVKMTLKTNY